MLPKKTKQPRFAVVTLDEGHDATALLKLCIENGYSTVSFLDDLTQHTETQERRDVQMEPQDTDPKDPVIAPSLNSLSVQTTELLNLINTPASPASATSTFSPPIITLSSTRRTRGSSSQNVNEKNISKINVACESTDHVLPMHKTSEVSTNSITCGIEQEDTFQKIDVDKIMNELHSTTNIPNPTSAELGTINDSPVEFFPSLRSTRNGATADDESLFMSCFICHNKLMTTRLSNLQNHVKRHASVKQYECTLCDYGHNEQAKVKRHMRQIHQLATPVPMDKRSPEIEKMWMLLMDQCFPGYENIVTEERHSSRRIAQQPVDQSKRKRGRPPKYKKYSNTDEPEDVHFCSTCGVGVNLNLPTGTSLPKNNRLVEHIEQYHESQCFPFSCDECGYMNAEDWKLRCHMSVRHPGKKSESTLVHNTTPSLFVGQFFPSAIEYVNDVEEDELTAILRSKNQKDTELNGQSG